MSETISIEVAYANPDEQLILVVEVPVSATIAEAIKLSHIDDHFPEIDMNAPKVGIFGKLAKLDATLNPGDRIEIYRPLIADPKEARKKRAAEGKTMKKGAKALNEDSDS